MDDTHTLHLKRHAAILLGAIFFFFLLRLAVEAVFAFESPPGAAAILPTILAALLLGQVRACRTDALPARDRARWFASAAGAVNLAVQGLLVLVILASFAALGGTAPGGRSMTAWALPFTSVLALGLIAIPVNRGSAIVGARSVLGRC